MERNAWFQKKATEDLHKLCSTAPSLERVVFAYSYAALEILRASRRLGYTTVLGQIDPGPTEQRIVDHVYRAQGGSMPHHERVA